MKSINIDPSRNEPPPLQLPKEKWDMPSHHVIRDERGRFIPASQKHIDNLEYAKKIKTPLDYLRIEPPKQVKETFKEEFEKWSKDPHHIPKSTQTVITQIEQAQTWPDKMVAKTSGLDRPVPVRHVRKPWGGGKCDCDGIKSICDEFRAKQEKEEYDAVIQQNPIEDMIIKNDYNFWNGFKYIFVFPLLALFVIFIYTIM